MNKTTSLKLSKRLTQYSALSLAIAGIVDVNGQIVYTDIADIGPHNQSLVLDLNGDGRDFDIRHDGSSNYGAILKIIPGYASLSNAILGLYNYSNIFPFALNASYTISAGNSNWNSNYQYQLLNELQCYNFNSYWCYGVSDKFLGLRFDIGGNTHYGWARLDVDPIMEWKLKDYAYNSTPDAPIDTGEGILGVNDALDSKVKIVALNKSIALYNLPEITSYKLYTMTGQSVLDGKIENNTYVIEANTLSSGVYIIELKDNNSKAIIRKKIVL